MTIIGKNYWDLVQVPLSALRPGDKFHGWITQKEVDGVWVIGEASPVTTVVASTVTQVKDHSGLVVEGWITLFVHHKGVKDIQRWAQDRTVVLVPGHVPDPKLDVAQHEHRNNIEDADDLLLSGEFAALNGFPISSHSKGLVYEKV